MKKLIFGLIATVMLGFVGNAQTMSSEAKQAALGAQVVTFVNVSKAFYTQGQSYDDFVKALLIPSPTVPSQEPFLRKMYSYVSSNTPACDIMQANHAEYKAFVTDISNNPRNQGDPVAMAKKKWWQILINVVINVGLDILVPGNTIDNIDLWP